MLDIVQPLAAEASCDVHHSAPKPLRIAIVTEAEPYYMAEAIEALLDNLPDDMEVVQSIVTAYGFGRQSVSSDVTSLVILRIFGAGVALRGLARYVRGRLRWSNTVPSILRQRGIPVNTSIRDVNSAGSLELLASSNVDVIVSIGFNRLFKRPLQSLPKLACINVHTGVHAEHRGRAGVFWALADRLEETGVTVHVVDDSVDAGQVIVKRRHKISTRSFSTLLGELRMLGMSALIDALKKLQDGQTSPQEAHTPASNSFRPVPSAKDLEAFLAAGNRIF
ncbi:MAG: hypothetical protein GY948_07310 [Alphaproteobacteria bacterium]|nr:hypothetical protein [Alphaproteobacteria bacterium]